MRRIFIIGLATTALVSTSIAIAHNTPWAWTEAAARKMVVRDATVRLPASERAALLAELNQAVRLFGALHFAAGQANESAPSDYLSYLARYVRARDQVQNGLTIGSAACKGSGAAVRGNRFKHFQCGVASKALEIPTTELDYGDRELPIVIEGPPRVIQPLESQLSIHVRGRSSFVYQATV